MVELYVRAERPIPRGRDRHGRQLRDRCTISCRMHQKKLFIPGSIGDKAVEFFIDSDANLSFVSESEARNLHLSVRDSKAQVYGAGGNQTNFRVSVADELIIGHVNLK